MKVSDYRKAMFKLYTPFQQYVEEQERVLPILVSAVEDEIAQALAEDKIVMELQTNLTRLIEVHRQMKESVSRAGVAVGSLREDQDVITGLTHQLADLTTRSQIFEVGMQYSEEFNLDWLEIVDLDVFEKALAKLPVDRLNLIQAAVSQAIATKRVL